MANRKRNEKIEPKGWRIVFHGKNVQANHSAAVRLLKKTAKSDALLTKQLLGWCYDRGVGFERDPEKSFQMYRESFNGGNLLATDSLAKCYDFGIGVKRDHRKAAEVFEHCLQVGTWEKDAKKAYYGLRLIQGLGVKQNIVYGKALILDATKCGYAIPWHALADCYRHGLGFPEDKKLARNFYHKAIACLSGQSGIIGSYLALGEMYESGEGVRSNISLANKYYLKAAERWSSAAQWKVALAFESGVGLGKDIHRAVYLYHQCANGGNRRAQNKYVMYYMRGHGVERNCAYGTKILKQEAETGNLSARRWIEQQNRRIRKSSRRRVSN